MICICQNDSAGRRPSAAEEGRMVALSHLPTFLGVEQKSFNGGLVKHWIVTSEFVDDVVTTSEEKKLLRLWNDFKKGTVYALSQFQAP